MRIVSKFCAFTVHETPTKNLLRFGKYYSQFSSDEFYLLFLPQFSWLMHTMVSFGFCIVFSVSRLAIESAKKGKCRKMHITSSVFWMHFLSAKERWKAKRKKILFLHVKCGAHANFTANPNVNEAKYSLAFMRKVFHRFSWCFVSYFHLYSILVLFRAAFFSRSFFRYSFFSSSSMF